MLNGLASATTQTEYYLELVRLTSLFAAGLVGTVVFFGVVYLIVFYSHYYK